MYNKKNRKKGLATIFFLASLSSLVSCTNLSKSEHYPPSESKSINDPRVAPITARSGPGCNEGNLVVLGPESSKLVVGKTTQKHPSLFWYYPTKTKCLFQFTLSDQSGNLILRKKFSLSNQGIQRIDLSNFKFPQLNEHLKIDVKYQWAVALINDSVTEADISINVAKVKIKRSALSNAEEPWYDAMRKISDLIEKHPTDAYYREQRIALLKQLGLQKEITDKVTWIDKQVTNGDY